MSDEKPQPIEQTGTRTATAIIGFMMMCGLATLAYMTLRIQPLHQYRVWSLLIMALLASRLKVKLPGMTGNMSVNVPFILIAMTQLSLFEALLVALSSSVAQCFPKRGADFKPVRFLFNISTMAVAVGVGGLIFQAEPLVLAAAGFFLAQTIPVASIIAATEHGSVVRIWSSIAHLSFPYYALSAGITSIVTTANQMNGWQTQLSVLLAMYAVYRSYQFYFRTRSTAVA